MSPRRTKPVLTPEILDDIKASILLTLGDDGPASIAALTETFQGSGYPTEREWVEIAAIQLAEAGKVKYDLSARGAGRRVTLVEEES